MGSVTTHTDVPDLGGVQGNILLCMPCFPCVCFQDQVLVWLHKQCTSPTKNKKKAEFSRHFKREPSLKVWIIPGDIVGSSIFPSSKMQLTMGHCPVCWEWPWQWYLEHSVFQPASNHIHYSFVESFTKMWDNLFRDWCVGKNGVRGISCDWVWFC